MKKLKIVEKAIELLKPIGYKPNYMAYYILVNEIDLSSCIYCKNCIEEAIHIENILHPDKRIGYEDCDPDFSGGSTYPFTCESCTDYFYTNFMPDLEEATYLKDEYFRGLTERLKWKLKVAFYNYEYLSSEVETVLYFIAKKILKNGAAQNRPKQ